MKSGESGTFYFDKSGSCKFSSKQQPDPEDLQKLIASEGIEATGASLRGEFGRGKALPSWSVVEAQTLRRVGTTELTAKSDQAWVFFLADCFSCGPASPDPYLRDFTAWRRIAKNINTTPIVVFDSAFLRRQVVAAWERLEMKTPVYLSEEDLRPLSKFG